MKINPHEWRTKIRVGEESWQKTVSLFLKINSFKGSMLLNFFLYCLENGVRKMSNYLSIYCEHFYDKFLKRRNAKESTRDTLASNSETSLATLLHYTEKNCNQHFSQLAFSQILENVLHKVQSHLESPKNWIVWLLTVHNNICKTLHKDRPWYCLLQLRGGNVVTEYVY